MTTMLASIVYYSVPVLLISVGVCLIRDLRR